MSSTTSTELLRSQEAMDLIAGEKDPITHALLANANFWLLKRYFEQGKLPVADLDYAFIIELLRDVFREHDVLRRMLAGEKVGQFSEDEKQEDVFSVRLVGSEVPELILGGRLDVTSAPQLQSFVYNLLSVPHHLIAINCENLSVINPWVIAIVWSFAEEARHKGIRVEVRGLDSSWHSYFETFTNTQTRGDVSHDSFMQSLFETFAELSSAHNRRK